MKVVNVQLSGCNGICQNPLAALREENTVAQFSLAVISSEVGKMYCSLLTDSFSLFKSTQILALPVYFRAGIIGAHHSVGCVTHLMMPLVSIP